MRVLGFGGQEVDGFRTQGISGVRVGFWWFRGIRGGLQVHEAQGLGVS